jgi:hypothetical protein
MASTIDQINPDPEMENVKKDLFKIAMQGKWEKVVEIYRTNPMAHKAKLTRSGDTALHIAVSDGQEERVEELVGSIISVKRESKEIKEVLNIKNELGNTPLHIAASMGNVAMCQCIANVDKSLVGARNYDNETLFSWQHSMVKKKPSFVFTSSVVPRMGTIIVGGRMVTLFFIAPSLETILVSILTISMYVSLLIFFF